MNDQQISPEAQVIQKTEQLLRPHIESAQTFIEPRVEAAKDFAKAKGITAKHIALWCGLALMGIVMLQNFESTSIDFLFWSVQAPKIVIFFLLMGIGSGLGFWLRNKFTEAKRATMN